MSAEPDTTVERVLRRLARRRNAVERYRPVGEGRREGLGEVLGVWDRDLRRELTMKRLVRGAEAVRPPAHDAALERFLQEARVTGQLDHPAIVPVHDVGLDAEGRAYFTMKLVGGEDLARVFERVRRGEEEWSRARALRILVRVCEALAHAHAQGVAHGALGPSSVLVGGFGAVYVTGWGVDRPGGEGPARASPGAGPAPAGDVHGVGALLYHLLSGRPPAQAPVPLPADAPAELVAICERAMARDPEARYAGARELADDLRAYLEDRVVRAHRTGALAEAAKWVRRNRALALTVGVSLLAALGGLAGTAWVQGRARERAREANAALAALNRELEDSNAQLEAARSAAEASRELAELRARQSESVTDYLIELFRAPRPELARGEELTAAQLLERGVASIQGADLEPLVRAHLLYVMGDGYRSLGRHARAAPLLDEASELWRTTLGDDAPETLRVRLAVAVNARESDPAEGVELLRTLREDCERALGGRHEISIVAEAALGRGLMDLGLVDESRSHLEHALRTAREVLGPADQTYLSTLGDLVLLYGATSEPERAEALHREALDSVRRALGPDHPDSITQLNNLAMWYCFQDRFVEAQPILEEAVERYRRVLGPDHPSTATALSSLAECYQHVGRADEAEGLLLEALAVLERSVGASHEHTILALNNLSAFYYRSGRLDDSERMLNEALSRVPAEGLSQLFALLSNLARIEMERGELADAERHYRESLDLRLNAFAPGHPMIQDARQGLVELYLLQGRYEEAEELALQLVDETPLDSPFHADRAALLEEIWERQDGAR